MKTDGRQKKNLEGGSIAVPALYLCLEARIYDIKSKLKIKWIRKNKTHLMIYIKLWG